MKVLIEIDTENDAFKPNPAREVARILHSESQRMKIDGLRKKILQDVNGNVIGFTRITTTEKEDDTHEST